jgi:hypothetical protein
MLCREKIAAGYSFSLCIQLKWADFAGLWMRRKRSLKCWRLIRNSGRRNSFKQCMREMSFTGKTPYPPCRYRTCTSLLELRTHCGLPLSRINEKTELFLATDTSEGWWRECIMVLFTLYQNILRVHVSETIIMQPLNGVYRSWRQNHVNWKSGLEKAPDRYFGTNYYENYH